MARASKTAASEAESFGVGTGGAQGATYSTKYLDREIKGVPVSIDELEEFKTGSIEEFGQFVFGNFLVAGSFWLGIERALTTEPFWKDLLFWICVVAFVAGAVITFFGYRQMRRRQTRIDKIILSAETGASKSDEN